MFAFPVIFDAEWDEVDPLITAIISARLRMETLGYMSSGYFTGMNKAALRGALCRDWWGRAGDIVDDMFLNARDKLIAEQRSCLWALSAKYACGRYRFGNYLVELDVPSVRDESRDWPEPYYSAELAIRRIPSNWRPL